METVHIVNEECTLHTVHCTHREPILWLTKSAHTDIFSKVCDSTVQRCNLVHSRLRCMVDVWNTLRDFIDWFGKQSIRSISRLFSCSQRYRLNQIKLHFTNGLRWFMITRHLKKNPLKLELFRDLGWVGSRQHQCLPFGPMYCCCQSVILVAERNIIKMAFLVVVVNQLETFLNLLCN